MDGFDFDAELWLWDARRSDTWVFLSVPPEVSAEIAERAAMRPRSGFGSVRVEVWIGAGRGSDRVDGVADVSIPGSPRPVRAAGEAVGPGG